MGVYYSQYLIPTTELGRYRPSLDVVVALVHRLEAHRWIKPDWKDVRILGAEHRTTTLSAAFAEDLSVFFDLGGPPLSGPSSRLTRRPSGARRQCALMGGRRLTTSTKTRRRFSTLSTSTQSTSLSPRRRTLCPTMRSVKHPAHRAAPISSTSRLGRRSRILPYGVFWPTFVSTWQIPVGRAGRPVPLTCRHLFPCSLSPCEFRPSPSLRRCIVMASPTRRCSIPDRYGRTERKSAALITKPRTSPMDISERTFGSFTT